MVASHRAVDCVSDAYLEWAERCRQKAVEVLADVRLSADEQAEAKLRFGQLADECIQMANWWRTGSRKE